MLKILTRLTLTSLSIFIIFSASSCSKKEELAAPVQRPVNVKFEPVKIGPITQFFETVGELKADKEITVSAERPGQIQDILVKEGDYVKEGQIIVHIKGKDVSADLEKAKADYDAYSKLFTEGAISKQELLQYETTLRRFEAQLDNLRIRAISSGNIGEIYVDPGDYVSQGDPILELVKNKPLRVTYSIPEKIIPLVKLGQKIEVETDAYPNTTFNAYIDFISPRVDPNNRAILVRAKLDDKNSLLKANQFTRVRQLIKSFSNEFLVREQAIYLDQGQEYLYIAVPMDKEESAETADNKAAQAAPQPTHTAKRVAIKTGLREEAYVQIINSDLNDTDLVIHAGLHSIYPGAQLVQVPEE